MTQETLVTPQQLALVSSQDPILTTRCEEYVFDHTKDSWSLALDLIQTMNANRGIGLAANQVGINKRVFVMNGAPPLACFNPRIVDVSEETITLEESCLSYRGLVVAVKRPKMIKVRFQDADGQMRTEKFTGMAARVFQHELDHLNGIRFYDKTDRYHRDVAMRKWKKWKRENG